MAERLDAYLSRSGHGTRSEVKRFILKGRVLVAGVTCKDPGRKVTTEEVFCAGAAVVRRRAPLTIVMNKPVGPSCSRDLREAPLVFDLLAESWRRSVEPAGRLDRDTSGLLVFSDDGDLLHRLTNPRRHVTKRYRAVYTGQLDARAVARCAEGFLIPDDVRPTRPSVLTLDLPGDDGRARATIEIIEGRYHQVRRMLAVLGGEVVALHRDRIGAFELPADLEPGISREMTETEVGRLFATGNSGPPPG